VELRDYAFSNRVGYFNQADREEVMKLPGVVAKEDDEEPGPPQRTHLLLIHSNGGFSGWVSTVPYQHGKRGAMTGGGWGDRVHLVVCTDSDRCILHHAASRR
jgi:hypothetical protein